MPSRNYRDLIAWQRAMDFAVSVYAATKNFPREELYGLTSQLRRSGVSIPSNIAEGQGRRVSGHFKHSLMIAHGSVCEAETQVILAERLGFLAQEPAGGLLGQASGGTPDYRPREVAGKGGQTQVKACGASCRPSG